MYGVKEILKWCSLEGKDQRKNPNFLYCILSVLLKWGARLQAKQSILPLLSCLGLVLRVASHCLAMGGGRMLRFPEVSEFFALIHFICNFPYIFFVYMSFWISSNFLVASLKLTKDYFAMLETLEKVTILHLDKLYCF